MVKSSMPIMSGPDRSAVVHALTEAFLSGADVRFTFDVKHHLHGIFRVDVVYVTGLYLDDKDDFRAGFSAEGELFKESCLPFSARIYYHFEKDADGELGVLTLCVPDSDRSLGNWQ